MNLHTILARQQKLLFAIKKILPNYKNQIEDDIILLKIQILLENDKKYRNKRII